MNYYIHWFALGNVQSLCGEVLFFDKSYCITSLTFTVLVTTIDAQWEGNGGHRVGEVRAGTTSPMPDHKGFKLQ